MRVEVDLQKIVDQMDFYDMAECQRLIESRQYKLREIKRNFPVLDGESKPQYVARLRTLIPWKDLFIAYDLKD